MQVIFTYEDTLVRHEQFPSHICMSFLLAVSAWSLLTRASVHFLLASGLGQIGRAHTASLSSFGQNCFICSYSIAEHARRNDCYVGGTVTDMSLVPVE